MTGKTKARIVALRIWVRRRDKRVMRLLLLAFLRMSDHGNRRLQYRQHLFAEQRLRKVRKDVQIF